MPRHTNFWKRDYAKFDRALDSFPFSEQQKIILQLRYLPLIRHLHYRANRIAMLFHTSRTIITVGSLIVPALLSIQYTDGVASTELSRQIYWGTWVVSLLVTMCNGLVTLFKLDKRYFYLYTTLEHMVSEGWQFLELTGKYSGFYTPGQTATHNNQFVYFCASIEKIRMKQIEEEYFKLTDKEQTNTNGQTQGQAAAAGAQSRAAGAGMIPLTPLQQELLSRVPPEVLAALQQVSQPPLENAGSRQNQAAGAAAAASAAQTTPSTRSTENEATSEASPNRPTSSVSMRILV